MSGHDSNVQSENSLDTPPRDVKNLVLCCDGTGNVWKPGPGKTNVVKLFESLAGPRELQLTYYDPGVGTPDGAIGGDQGGGLSLLDILRRVGGLAWGDGVWANVAEAYEFLIRYYSAGDRIFLFGFSRGAFTARAVSGLIHMFGVLRPGHENLIPTLLRVYRSRASNSRNTIAKSLKDQFSMPDTCVHFIGCWDTVESVGIWQFLGAHITSDAHVKSSFRHVRHAMALDELRWPFKPRAYLPRANGLSNGTSYKQVWFRGAHSDIGGGYTDAGLSHITLHWMAREANEQGLMLDFDKLENGRQASPFALLHDAIAEMPTWIVAGAFKRELPQDLTLHESVRRRAEYDPFRGFPQNAGQPDATTRKCITLPDGSISPRPVPAEPEATVLLPRRQPVARWVWPLLALAWIVTAVLFSSASNDSSRLAFDLQLGLDRQSWFELGKALANFEGSTRGKISELMRRDTGLIVAYSVALTLSSVLLLRFACHRNYTGVWLGRTSCIAGFSLTLADLTENWLTLQALEAYRTQACTWNWIPCTVSEPFLSLTVSLASGIKFIALAVVLLTSLCYLAIGIRQRLQRLTRPLN